MATKAISKWLAVLAVLLAAVSCREPLSRETFVKRTSRDALGRYAYILDLGDSLRTYDLNFYTRSTLSERRFMSSPDTCRYDLELVAPSGKSYGETFYFLRDSFSQSTFFSKTFQIPFRSGFRPSEYGKWQLYISLDADNTLGLDGFGVRLSKN